jgi:hypothetical protein
MVSQKSLRLVLAGSLAGAALAASLDWILAPVVLVVLLITLWPLTRRRRLWFVGDVESEHAILTRRREEALRSLKDLEDDHLAGKLSREEFAARRPELLEAAKTLTAELQRLQERRAAARRRIESELASGPVGQSAKAPRADF